MDQAVCLTNRDLQEINNRIQKNADQFELVKTSLDDIKCDTKAITGRLDAFQTELRNFRSDIGDTVSRMTGVLESKIETVDKKIGEVPDGKTVMECVRVNAEKTDKITSRIYWFAGFIGGAWALLSWVIDKWQILQSIKK